LFHQIGEIFTSIGTLFHQNGALFHQNDTFVLQKNTIFHPIGGIKRVYRSEKKEFRGKTYLHKTKMFKKIRCFDVFSLSSKKGSGIIFSG